MRGPELYGRQPDNIHWSADSRWIYFTWLEPGTDWREELVWGAKLNGSKVAEALVLFPRSAPPEKAVPKHA